MRDWSEYLRLVLAHSGVGDIEKCMIGSFEAYRNISDWEQSVDKLVVRDEEPPQTDERVYLTQDRRNASTMTEHLHRYRLVRLFAVGLDVLDLCCGVGYGTALLKQVAKSVIGVDYDKGAISWSERYYPEVDCQVMDARSLGFTDETFDLVVSMEAIEHMDDIHAYLSEVRRVLRRNGAFLFSTPYTPDPEGKCTYNPAAFPHKWGFTHEFLQKELEKFFTQVKLFSQRHDRFMSLTIPCYYMGLCWG